MWCGCHQETDNKIWHAVKLTGIHFAVSHSQMEYGHRVFVVDINNSSVSATFDEFPFSMVIRYHIPICLVGHRGDSVLVADASYKRVLIMSHKEQEFEDILIETDKSHFPVRLCLNETKDRFFVDVNSGQYSKPETWTEGCILIYN